MIACPRADVYGLIDQEYWLPGADQLAGGPLLRSLETQRSVSTVSL